MGKPSSTAGRSDNMWATTVFSRITGRKAWLSFHSPAASVNKYEIRWQVQVLVFLITCVAVVSRRPDAFFNPQFFCEDGSVWYAEAYNLGWLHSLTTPYAGYFVTLQRLVALPSVLVPLRFAPLLMNLIGIAIQAAPVNLLLSTRSSTWGSLSIRAPFALAYLALPNTGNIDVTITNAQWHLALLACILVLAGPAPSRTWRVLDITVILLSGLTGPFCLMLLPVAFVYWWIRRERSLVIVVATLAATSIIQAAALYRTASVPRSPMPPGATLNLFVRILAGQVYLGALLGRNNLGIYGDIRFLALIALLGTAIVTYCCVKAELHLKLFVLFSLLVFAASLKSPSSGQHIPGWEVLKAAADARYWFFPMLAFAWSLIWCIHSGRLQIFQVLSTAMVCVMCVGIAMNWRYAPYPDLNFQEYAREFDLVPAGSVVTIPLYPEGWAVKLKKRASTSMVPTQRAN